MGSIPAVLDPILDAMATTLGANDDLNDMWTAVGEFLGNIDYLVGNVTTVWDKADSVDMLADMLASFELPADLDETIDEIADKVDEFMTDDLKTLLDTGSFGDFLSNISDIVADIVTGDATVALIQTEAESYIEEYTGTDSEYADIIATAKDVYAVFEDLSFTDVVSKFVDNDADFNQDLADAGIDTSMFDELHTTIDDMLTQIPTIDGTSADYSTIMQYINFAPYGVDFILLILFPMPIFACAFCVQCCQCKCCAKCVMLAACLAIIPSCLMLAITSALALVGNKGVCMMTDLVFDDPSQLVSDAIEFLPTLDMFEDLDIDNPFPVVEEPVTVEETFSIALPDSNFTLDLAYSNTIVEEFEITFGEAASQQVVAVDLSANGPTIEYAVSDLDLTELMWCSEESSNLLSIFGIEAPLAQIMQMSIWNIVESTGLTSQANIDAIQAFLELKSELINVDGISGILDTINSFASIIEPIATIDGGILAGISDPAVQACEDAISYMMYDDDNDHLCLPDACTARTDGICDTIDYATVFGMDSFGASGISEWWTALADTDEFKSNAVFSAMMDGVVLAYNTAYDAVDAEESMIVVVNTVIGMMSAITSIVDFLTDLPDSTIIDETITAVVDIIPAEFDTIGTVLDETYLSLMTIVDGILTDLKTSVLGCEIPSTLLLTIPAFLCGGLVQVASAAMFGWLLFSIGLCCLFCNMHKSNRKMKNPYNPRKGKKGAKGSAKSSKSSKKGQKVHQPQPVQVVAMNQQPQQMQQQIRLQPVIVGQPVMQTGAMYVQPAAPANVQIHGSW
ncbi:hypothetical protein KIPB_005733 [Kipferlia bialata]|uniref:Uncharacterized protein n=1 Tax=Kipferlia bialata TaxID=797122 RepID=A0A9K3CZ16_9EUKA|nr:hypothetical protein KIPB_005733 [Kipferlia bialata]|eukprot:g5733.t1